MKITKEEIRIKVAESLGWKKCDPEKYECNVLWHLMGHGYALESQLPNYPESLDACAEFEATLTVDEQTEYWMHLITLCNEAAREQNNFRLVGIFYQITAKPTQRCLAYLKTKGIIQ